MSVMDNQPRTQPLGPATYPTNPPSVPTGWRPTGPPTGMYSRPPYPAELASDTRAEVVKQLVVVFWFVLGMLGWGVMGYAVYGSVTSPGLVAAGYTPLAVLGLAMVFVSRKR